MSPRRTVTRPCALLLAFVILWFGPTWATGIGEADDVGDCQALVQSNPDDFESYRCFWMIARKYRLWDEATRALEGMIAVNPQDHRAKLYLAAISADHGMPRAETLYGEAASGFAEEGSARGEVFARLALAYYLRRSGRPDEAVPQVEASLEAATRSEEPELLGRVHLSQASQAMEDADYGRALALLREAEKGAFPSGPLDLRTSILSARGRTAWSLGLQEKALEAYEREAELYRMAGDYFQEAAPRYNMALMALEIASAGRLDREEYRVVLDRAVAVAQQVGHRFLEVKSRLLLGLELVGPRAVDEFREALDIAQEIGDRPSVRLAKRRIAETSVKEGLVPLAESYALADEVVEDASLAGDLEDVARGLCLRAWISGTTDERESWFEDYERAFHAVERIRNLQPEGTVRARIFTRWTFPYYRFAGGLLEGLATSPDPDGDLERALRAVERMRARVLLDELDAAGAVEPADSGDAGRAARIEVLGRISGLQRQLVDGSLESGQRSTLLEELESLEAEEFALRDAIAREDRRFGNLHAPQLSTVSEIAELLAPDQAFLSFQLAPPAIASRVNENNGGSWLIVVTREESHALPLPETNVLEDQVAVLLGLFHRRDGADAAAAERLYTELLVEAVRVLDPEVRSLVIVPDGRLHRLPFAGLQRDGDGRRLAEIYEITVVPSATLWTRWKRSTVDPEDRPQALVLADPQLSGNEPGNGARSVDPWHDDGLRFGPLPGARREARTVKRSVGGGVRVLQGAEASESSLKQAHLGEVDLLHFATHAVVDDDRPDRSAVILAAGDDVEDGLLQIREIVNLDLDDAVVILTGCRSASGSLIEGEGPLGLARGFFQAGARAVVGSVWALRDDDAERFVREFSRAVSRGKSVAGALAQAQRARIRAGAPPEAWAGMVVLGDGDLVLMQAKKGSVAILVAAAVAVVAMIAIGAAMLRGLTR